MSENCKNAIIRSIHTWPWNSWPWNDVSLHGRTDKNEIDLGAIYIRTDRFLNPSNSSSMTGSLFRASAIRTISSWTSISSIPAILSVPSQTPLQVSDMECNHFSEVNAVWRRIWIMKAWERNDKKIRLYHVMKRCSGEPLERPILTKLNAFIYSLLNYPLHRCL